MELHLEVESGPGAGEVFVLRGARPRLLGRGPGVDFCLQDPGAPRQALALCLVGARLQAQVQAPGVLHNDQPLQPGALVELLDGDDLRVGQHLLRVDLQPDSETQVLDGRARGQELRAEQEALEALISPREFREPRLLGEGAAGKVYAAFWIPRQRWVALKVLHPWSAQSEEAYQRFYRECEALSRLQHPNVVAVFDLRRSPQGRAMSVMELIEGPSLRELLATRRLSLGEALRVAEDVALALAAAASLGIVHRDVKPANVVLSKQGLAKLCDFGLVKDLDAQLESLTLSGTGMGTMAYLPPEQISEAKHVDASADVYALGATLYHMLAGEPPFLPTSAEALVQICELPPPPLAAKRPECPPEVIALVEACLAKESEERPTLRKLGRSLRRARERHCPQADLRALFRP